jgi:hypothetical protein
MRQRPAVSCRWQQANAFFSSRQHVMPMAEAFRDRMAPPKIAMEQRQVHALQRLHLITNVGHLGKPHPSRRDTHYIACIYLRHLTHTSVAEICGIARSYLLADLVNST